MPDLDKYVAAAHEAVDVADAILRASRDHSVAFKGDRDPVTETDLAIERAMRNSLHRTTPEAGFLGEETGGSTDGLAWVLDPIDGTANFTHGVPMTAVSLALLDHGEPIIGLIAVQAEGVRYAAMRGQGATRDGDPISASACTQLRSAMIALGDYATGPDAAERNQTRLRITAVLAARAQRVRMLGSAAIDLAWVAAGKLDASVMLSNKPWDTAAGVLLAREAGARVTDLEGRTHDLASTATIAAAPGVGGTLLDALASSSVDR
ncbi:inositol monophosphatase family protein [Nocardioides sp. NPDC051685]|uniref:inositol monophosphatase family protein n=1 Tax=Nocardioides sp. NPDC051685 TaxID=3364334 RepID=UPI0037A46980